MQAITPKKTPPVTRRLLVVSLVVIALAALANLKLFPRISLITHHLSQRSRSVSSKMSAYSRELEVAELAVQRASILTKKVFVEKTKGTISKDVNSALMSDRRQLILPAGRVSGHHWRFWSSGLDHCCYQEKLP